MRPVAHIKELISPALADMGFDIIKLQLSGDKRPKLLIMIDRLDEELVTVDDCADVSREVSAILDVEDPIEDRYTLEVSSPGIDRPLSRPRDFERFAGFDAKVEMEMPIDGQKRFQGKLLGLVDDHVHLEIKYQGEQVEIALPLKDVKQAKLLMSDALLKAGTPANDAADEG
ncbi:ribosome maturation factor RimP [Aestuariispira ectoiniformans]|uniref:ribosome maturation factor RimP n=1 Tax=Aestuariispira ectoiniformans TaxID=2775080 RepID=UPI00223BC92F|nr:ribosome maturation factor RimP [Aestuariispira ectoiniformans]